MRRDCVIDSAEVGENRLENLGKCGATPFGGLGGAFFAGRGVPFVWDLRPGLGGGGAT